MKFHRFGVLGLVVLSLAALFNLAALYMAERSFVDEQETLGAIRRSQQAHNLIEQIRRLAADAEAGQRAFLLTQDRTFLAPYQDAVRQSSSRVQQLRELVRDNPVQVAQLATVTSLLQARLAQIDKSVGTEGEASNASTALQGGTRDSATTDSLRLALNGMAAEEGRLHERRLQTFGETQTRVEQGFLIVVGLNLLLVSLGAVLLA